MASKPKLINFDEYVIHNQRDDCWLLINNKVYNVTDFMEEHPGGDEVLLAASAKDATEDFEEIGHSESAKETMKKFYIGDINVKSLPSDGGKKHHRPHLLARNGSSNALFFKLLQFLLPLLILAFALAFKFNNNHLPSNFQNFFSQFPSPKTP